MDGNEKKRKKNTGKMIISMILVMLFTGCLIGTCVFTVQYLRDLQDYKHEQQELEDLRDLVVKQPSDVTKPPVDTDSTTSSLSDTTSPSTETEEPVIDLSDPIYTEIDFDTLLAKNEDATRWVSIPGTPLNYPVMQERTVGKFSYLYAGLDKKYSSIGTPLTPAIPLGIDDPHILLFGHSFSGNHDLGFYTIKGYFERSYFEEHPYVYVYYPDRTEKWLAIEIKNVMGTDKVYDIPYTYGSQDYKELQQYLFAQPYRQQLAEHIGGITENDPILILSTCDRQYANNGGRAILICRLAAVLDRETMEITQVYPAPAESETTVSSGAGTTSENSH